MRGQNDYTCYKMNGQSVVDYVLCDHDTIENVTSLNVFAPNKLIADFKLDSLLDEN